MNSREINYFDNQESKGTFNIGESQHDFFNTRIQEDYKKDKKNKRDKDKGSGFREKLLKKR